MSVNKNDVQGDVWSKGFAKFNETYYFFSIADQKQKIFSQCLKKLAAQSGDASLITSISQAQKDRETADAANARHDKALLSNALIAFTRTGLEAIQSALPNRPLNPGVLKNTDPAFHAGMAAKSETDSLSDPDFTQWDPLFKSKSTPIHGLLKIAGSDADEVNKKLQAILKVLQHGTVTLDVKGISPPNTVESRIDGAVKPKGFNLDGKIVDLNGKELFGFEDGISQPLIQGIDTLETAVPSVANMNTDAEVIILSNKSNKSTSVDRPVWTNNRTFLVFRKLEQDKKAFNELIEKWKQNGLSSKEQMGAKLIGRWESGAPIVDFSTQDISDPALAKKLNTFNYIGDEGNLCPLAAHIRKTNPRTNDSFTRRARIVRNGIPYGSEFTEKPLDKRGLLFACYQSHIESGFKFIQETWSNNESFPRTETGHDPIIGHLNVTIGGTKMNFDELVTLKGGEYFFVPSISALQTTLGQA
ncbi:Nn.00g006040.m01.CDS01 [Neocucurbitaria sp. VM-36]